MVRPVAFRSTSSDAIEALVVESRLPVGSSARTIAGSATRARAMPTRWRSPPDRAPGRRSRWAPRLHGVERRRGAAQTFAAADAGVEQTGGDVLEGGEPFDEVELLEHEPDAPAAQSSQLGVAQSTDVVAVDAHPTGGRPVQRADDVDQRRLARPGRPDDGHQLAVADREVDAAQRRHRWCGRVGLGDRLQLQCGDRRLCLLVRSLEDSLAHATTTFWPSATSPSISTMPSAKAPSVTRT